MDILKPLMPYGASIAVALIALWCLKQFFGESFKELGRRFAQRLIGGNRILGRRQQRRYQKNLLLNTSRHPLGFLRDQTIEIDHIYVPLQIEDGGRRRDVYQEVRGRNRVVMLGGAGAGKSMLLKSSAHRWAKDPQEGVRLPILVELHRYNDENSSLISLAEEALARNGLRGALPMLEKALEGGQVSLMLDGLDEVSTSRRARAVHEIRLIAETYPDCQVVVTCRDAVYDGGLAPTFENPVTIAPFDDAAMRRFLLLWFTHHGAADRNVREQVDRMMSDLRSNPPVLRLARSPLLLTMMASLHAMDPGLGPSFLHSRAEFYREAIEHLLKRDFALGRHEKVASYRAGHKQLALRRIALHTQGGDDPVADGRTLSVPVALTLMRTLLAELNMEATHAWPMFEEIVERSELLIPVDGARLRYEFPHLTLQEYLAAIELGDDPTRLLRLYRTNPTRWRETVKLWCAGVNRDCTKVVLDIFSGDTGDPVLALECLAEAKKVDDTAAVRIVNHFQERIGTADSESHLVTAALGAVAGDGGPRGRAVLAYLRQMAMNADDGKSRSAMQALAASRLPEAVEFLARLAVHQSNAHDALRSMGEQAVPELVALAWAGSVEAVEDVAAIATPSAALGLVELIWDDSPIATQAAWKLATLIGNTDVQEEIRLASVEFPRSPQRYSWVWEPFGDGNVLEVVGRVCFLIANSLDNQVPKAIPTLDARLALPLAAFSATQEYRTGYLPSRDQRMVHHLRSLVESAAKKSGRLPGSFDLVHLEAAPPSALRRLLQEVDPKEALPFCLKFLRKAGATPKTIALWRCLQPRAAIVLASGAFWRGRPRRKIETDWRRVNKELVDDRFIGLVGLTLLGLTIVSPAALGIVRAVLSLLGRWRWGPEPLHVIVLLPLVLSAVVIYASGRSGASGELVDRFAAPVIFATISISVIASSIIGLATLSGWWGFSWIMIAYSIGLGGSAVLVMVAATLSARLTHVFSAALRSSRIQPQRTASIIGKRRARRSL